MWKMAVDVVEPSPHRPSIYTHLNVDNLKGRIFDGEPWAVSLFLHIGVGDVHNQIHPKLLYRWHQTIWTKRFSGLPMIPTIVGFSCVYLHSHLRISTPRILNGRSCVRNQYSYTIANKPLVMLNGIGYDYVAKCPAIGSLHFFSDFFFHLTHARCRLEVHGIIVLICVYLELLSPPFRAILSCDGTEHRRLALLLNAGSC